MKRYRQVEAFILSGGVSSRMGRDKSLLEFQGIPLLVRTARLTDPLVRKVTVVGSPERYVAIGLHTIMDRDFAMAGRESALPGPLAGIASALSTAHAPWNLILACDLPFLTAEWLDWLLARAMESAAQIVLPRTHRGLEPLAAVYRRECAAQIIAELKRGIRKVTDTLATLRVEVVHECEWHSFAPDGRMLRNMNTPADYEEARTWWNLRDETAHSRKFH